MSDSNSPENRRFGERYFACFPASVTPSDMKQRLSIIRDLSESGALLLVATTKIVMGEKVSLDLHIATDGTTFRTTSAKVVRIEEVAPHESGLWLRKIAVQFDEPLAMYAAEIASFRERAEKLGHA
jgi:hypothetical protein